MSELKAFTFCLGQYTENGSPCVVAVDDEENPRLASDEKFYLKSEADEVIEKKDMEIFNLKEELSYIKADSTFDRDKHKTEVKELLCLIRDKENNFNRAFDSEEKEIRRLKRALWLARAMRAYRAQYWGAYVEYVHFHEKSFYEFDGDDIFKRDNHNNDSFREWNRRWVSVERKCRAKAEEYK